MTFDEKGELTINHCDIIWVWMSSKWTELYHRMIYMSLAACYICGFTCHFLNGCLWFILLFIFAACMEWRSSYEINKYKHPCHEYFHSLWGFPQVFRWNFILPVMWKHLIQLAVSVERCDVTGKELFPWAWPCIFCLSRFRYVNWMCRWLMSVGATAIGYWSLVKFWCSLSSGRSQMIVLICSGRWGG